MSKFDITISGKRTEYSTYVFTINAKSLEEAKKKAQRLAADDNGDFEDKYCDHCDAGDAYDEFTVEDVRPANGGK